MPVRDYFYPPSEGAPLAYEQTEVALPPFLFGAKEVSGILHAHSPFGLFYGLYGGMRVQGAAIQCFFAPNVIGIFVSPCSA